MAIEKGRKLPSKTNKQTYNKKKFLVMLSYKKPGRHSAKTTEQQYQYEWKCIRSYIYGRIFSVIM